MSKKLIKSTVYYNDYEGLLIPYLTEFLEDHYGEWDWKDDKRWPCTIESTDDEIVIRIPRPKEDA